eukprot:5001798-Pyramimonas_sp.AAC.1
MASGLLGYWAPPRAPPGTRAPGHPGPATEIGHAPHRPPGHPGTAGPPGPRAPGPGHRNRRQTSPNPLIC